MADEEALEPVPWYLDESIYEPEPEKGPGTVNDWMNQPDVTGKQFPIDPQITAEQLDVLPEMTDTSRMIEGFSEPGEGAEGPITGTLRRIGTELKQGWMQMSTSDPMELGQQMQNRFPDVVEVRLAINPEGDGSYIPVARNKLTGYEAVINKPGMSAQDVLQTIGLVGQYLPAAKATTAVKAIMPRIAVAATTSGATETAIQAGQASLGGEFDPEDVALATVFSAVPEIVAKPAVGLALKTKELLSRNLPAAVPATIRKALEFAERHKYKITSSDALQEFLTAPQRIFLKITERIPIFGTQRIKNAQKAQRADALKRMADEFGIDIETDLGQEIAESFMDRMKSWRFFGKNQNPTDEMIDKAFKREAADVIDGTLKRKIKGATVENGNIDDVLIDSVFRSKKAQTVRDLMRKLTPEGQDAARRRFVQEGLNRTGYRPGQQVGISSPGAFVKYLDEHDKVIKELFPEKVYDPRAVGRMRAAGDPDPGMVYRQDLVDQRDYLDGIREFLRITDDAEKASAGAGMTAAMAAGGGFYLFDMMGGAMAGALTAMTGHAMQSRLARNLFLRLKHSKGNPEMQNAIMRELRPLILGTGNKVLQEGVDMPMLNMSINPDMVQEGAETGAEAAMQILRGTMGTIGETIGGVLGSSRGDLTEGGVSPTDIGSGSLVQGPGMELLRRAAESAQGMQPPPEE